MLTFEQLAQMNASRLVKWHKGTAWSTSDWVTAVTGELGELASLVKMMNRTRDGLPGNKFDVTTQMLADELADVVCYLDLLSTSLGISLGKAVTAKFNAVSERMGFEERLGEGDDLLCFYVKRNVSGFVVVKTEAFFNAHGSPRTRAKLRELWGRVWARDRDHARALGDKLLPK